MKIPLERLVRRVLLSSALCGALLTSMVVAGFFQENRDQHPDVVLRSDAIVIQADSPDQVHRFEIPTEQVKDRWIRAIEFKPGDSRVVRSAFFTIDKTGQWLGAWSPQEQIIAFPETVAASLPAGSKVIMEVYYQAVAEDVQDQSSLSLFFTDKKPLRPLTGMGVDAQVQLPASEEDFSVRKEFTVIADSYALAVRPEMASAGRSVEIMTVDPSGASQVLLALSEFKQDAQNPHTFEQPVFLPKGTKIVATAVYHNPDTEAINDLFKLTMSMYPSSEHRPAPDPALAGTKRAPAPAKKAAPKKTVRKKATPKKP